jgi:glycosyltransferase involved in cell wall biosynthesis
MNPPTITVIIPAYRASRTIGRAVESLRTQEHRPDEVLIIDDGSPDDLAVALTDFGAFVTVIRKPNGGAASARNLGIDLARSDLIAFLDADDYWEPSKLRRQARVFRDHPEVGLVGSRFFEAEPDHPRRLRPSKHEGLFGRVIEASGEQVFDVMEEFWTTVVVVRREVLGDHRFVPGLEPAEDRDLWLRLIESTPIFLDPEPLATWVLEPGSLSRSSIDRDCANMLRVVHRHQGLLGPRGLRNWESSVFRRWAAGHLGQGLPRAALAPSWERLRRQPGSLEAWWIFFKCATMSANSRISTSRSLSS